MDIVVSVLLDWTLFVQCGCCWDCQAVSTHTAVRFQIEFFFLLDFSIQGVPLSPPLTSLPPDLLVVRVGAGAFVSVSCLLYDVSHRPF